MTDSGPNGNIGLPESLNSPDDLERAGDRYDPGGGAARPGKRDHGAGDIYIAATHAVFAPPAMERLSACPFTKLAVTDTIPIGNRCDSIKDRLAVLSVAELLGEAIHRIHHNESISALFRPEGNGARD